MMEWSIIISGLEKLFIVGVAIVGYLIRRSLDQQEKFNKKMEVVLEEILKQVNKTNGRVSVLEAVNNHQEKEVADLWSRLNNLYDNWRKG